MRILSHYYKCSPEYLGSISPGIEKDVKQALDRLPTSKDFKNLSDNLTQILISEGWTSSQASGSELCKTSSTIEIGTKSDFAKKFGTQMIQLEIQSYDLEEIASDLIKFRIAFAEKRIQAGIEVTIQNSDKTDAFENVKDMLVKLDVDCPVWLIGIA